MSETDPDEIDLDDLVTQDDLDEIRDAIEGGDGDDPPEDPEPSLPWDSPEEAPFATTEDVTDAADQTFMQRLQHLAHDECDTPECEALRDEFGLSGAGSPEGGADAGADDEPEGEGNDPDENPGESESTESGSDGDGSGGDGETDGDDTYTPPWEQ